MAYATDPNQPFDPTKKRQPLPGEPGQPGQDASVTLSPAPPAAQTNTAAPAPAPAPAAPAGFNAQHPQVQELMRSQPGWTEQQAIDWATRYYQAPQAAPTQVPQTPGMLPDPVGQQAPAPGPGQGANAPVPGAQQPPQTVNEAFRQAIMTQLTKDPTQVDRAAIDPQVTAFKTAQQRSMERNKAQLAESAALEGTSTSGGALADRIGLEQGRASAEGGFEASLVGQQLMQQREQLMQAMALAQQYGTAQDQMALQEKLTQLNLALQKEGMTVDADLRRRALDLQGSLGQGDLALRRLLGEGQLGLGRDNLGFNYAQLQAMLNRDSLMALLGGG
jgi:hypothetical protein